MDIWCVVGWCAQAAEQVNEAASEQPASGADTEYAKWIGLGVFLLAQLLAPWILRRYDRRIVKVMSYSSRHATARRRTATGALESVESMVDAVRSRSRMVLAFLCVSVGVFAIVAGLFFAYPSQTAGMRVFSTVTSIILFAALGGPIILLGVSATKFGERFWTWFAPLALAAIVVQLEIMRAFQELGRLESNSGADSIQAEHDFLIYCLIFTAVVIATLALGIYTQHHVSRERWRRIRNWIFARKWRIALLVFGVLAAIGFVTDPEPAGIFTFMTQNLFIGGTVAAIVVGACYVSLRSRSQRVVVPLIAAGGFALFSSFGFFEDRLMHLNSEYLGWFADGHSAISLIAFACSGLLAWFVLGWIGLAYEHKVFSDAQFEVYAWTLSVAGLVVFFESVVGGMALYSTSSVGVGIGAVAALVVYSMLTRWWSLPPGSSKRLLLLRVFAQDRRSELLLDEVAYRWRFIGPIMMIGGPDLARSTVDPAEIAHFLRWQFQEDFVGDRRTLERRIVSMDERPDPDGRYRVNEFFCFDDVWQEAVERLVKRSDTILLDLRGFTTERRGTAFEIGLLTRLNATGRTVFLLDATTDLAAIVKAIGAKAFMAVPANHRVQTATTVDGEALFRALAECAVATSPTTNSIAVRDTAAPKVAVPA